MGAFFFLHNSDPMLVPLPGLFPPELSLMTVVCLHVFLLHQIFNFQSLGPCLFISVPSLSYIVPSAW